MLNLNRAMIIGNATRDPEIKTIPSGQPVAHLVVATNFTWRDQAGNRQSKVEYHRVIAWRRLAEIIKQFIHKGSKVYVEGRMQTRSWDDQMGNKRYITELVAENLIILDSRQAAGNFDNEIETTPTDDIASAPTTDEQEISIEDIPF
jgi:single-strand DNA-binding protein